MPNLPENITQSHLRCVLDHASQGCQLNYTVVRVTSQLVVVRIYVTITSHRGDTPKLRTKVTTRI